MPQGRWSNLWDETQPVIWYLLIAVIKVDFSAASTSQKAQTQLVISRLHVSYSTYPRQPGLPWQGTATYGTLSH